MPSLGKLANSLVSVASDNTIALLSVNVDFAVVRCDPPPEYAPVGSALTTKRKHEAENGSIHATACKLGFLFHEMLPDTPKLLKAYGTRVSEILSRPDINPEGTDADGPFRAFIGADCTSIWAAATSGPASISVLLLACMLSRAWDAKTAISIWFELVEERRRQIQAEMEDNKIVHPHSMAAAKQEIGRRELAEWDASARSWLRRADLFMNFSHTQFRLVADNLAIPYLSAGSTFEKVTMAWTRSTEVVERLLGNLPQQGCDRAILLAISSWHLYPDLLVFQQEAKKVPFGDALFPSTGILSLGLEYKGPSDNITRWSLALSHLRYYGDPVPVCSNEDHSRVRIHQLWLVALGAIFRQWGVSYANFDIAVEWFRDLHTVLSSQGARPELSWIVRLCAAAAGADQASQSMDRSLIRYGWRRGSQLLGRDSKAMHSPFFGLCNPQIMDALTQPTDVDCGIAYLRGLASKLGIGVHEGVISYTGMLDHQTVYTEWATIAPIEPHLGQTLPQSKVDATKNGSHKTNVRWIHYHQEKRGIDRSALLQQRCHGISRTEEVCYIVSEDDMYNENQILSRRFSWVRLPRVFGEVGPVEFKCLPLLREDGTTGFRLWVTSEKHDSKSSAYFRDQMGRAAMAIAPLEQGKQHLRQKFPPNRVIQYLIGSFHVLGMSHETKIRSSASIVSGLKRKAPMDESTPDENHQAMDLVLARRIVHRNLTQDDITGCIYLMSGGCNRSKQWLMSMRILELVHEFYVQLPGATVSLRIVEQDLLKAKWLPPKARQLLDSDSTFRSFTHIASTPVTDFMHEMTRAASFACIAMFESGRFNIDPDQLNEVIALCSEDSIFVAGILLSDPSVHERGTRIRHLVGNVGRPGMVLMVSPLQPRVRAVEHNPLLVKHELYDGKDADSFRGTSLHLSFTTWQMSLDWQNTGEIDQDIFLIESVVSVQDNGKWLADIDVVELEKDCPDVIERFRCNQHCASRTAESDEDIVSIDSWEEFFDLPPCVGVFRTKRNWVARLAVASILAQQGKGNGAVLVTDETICWSCLSNLYEDPEPHLPQLIIH